MVRTLDQVVDVDYYIPGCPPTPEITKAAVGALLAGKLPPKGQRSGPGHRPVRSVPAQSHQAAAISLSPRFKRPHLAKLDPTRVFSPRVSSAWARPLAPAARPPALSGGMPCSGCFGPTSRVRDQGAKYLSSLCANIAAKEKAEIAETLAGIPDPVGTFYRYGLAESLLRRRVDLNES